MSKLALAFLLFSSQCFAADPWTNADTYREDGYIFSHAIDWLQTRTLAKDGWKDGRHELNPILGEYPSTKRLDLHFAVTSLGHYYIATLLPTRLRKYWQYIAIIDSTNAVVGNHLAGIRIKF